MTRIAFRHILHFDLSGEFVLSVSVVLERIQQRSTYQNPEPPIGAKGKLRWRFGCLAACGFRRYAAGLR
jgi:hypothetical protein